MKNRKANRMREYDYSQAGYYFVTICTQNRKELFGAIIDDRMIANAAGKMVEETWDELSRFYEGIRTDQFQIMPNHVHGIIAIVHVGTGLRACPNSGQPQGVVPTLSLSDVIHRFKSFTTHQYISSVKHDGWKPFDEKLWQRSFYDHRIRKDEDMNRIRAYIQNNPLQWSMDKNNPNNWT